MQESEEKQKERCSHIQKKPKDTVVKSVTHRMEVSPKKEDKKSKGHVS